MQQGNLSQQRYSCVSSLIDKYLNPGLKGEPGLSSASRKTDQLDTDS